MSKFSATTVEKQYLSVPQDFTRQPHPKTVPEAATFFDENFPGWFSLIDLRTFNLFNGHGCIFGQVFGDYRFDLYRKVFLEEDEGLPINKQPANPGIFWKDKYVQQWLGEIRKRVKANQSSKKGASA